MSPYKERSRRRHLVIQHDPLTRNHVADADSIHWTYGVAIPRGFAIAGCSRARLAPLIVTRRINAELRPGAIDVRSSRGACLGAGRPRRRRCMPAREMRPGGNCGLTVAAGPAGDRDAPASGTFHRPSMLCPLLRRNFFGLRPRTARCRWERPLRNRAAAPRVRPESSRLALRSSRDDRSRLTYAPYVSLQRGRFQTWTDWINVSTCDQGNERSVASRTCRT